VLVLKLSDLIDEVARLIAEAKDPFHRRDSLTVILIALFETPSLHPPNFLTLAFSSRTSQEKHPATVLEHESLGTKSINSDGHLITEDSVLPTTAPSGAPEQNRCYQTPATLLILPLAPASLARSAHLAPLTTLRPRLGAGAV
jgi:hypothetical protein